MLPCVYVCIISYISQANECSLAILLILRFIVKISISPFAAVCPARLQTESRVCCVHAFLQLEEDSRHGGGTGQLPQFKTSELLTLSIPHTSDSGAIKVGLGHVTHQVAIIEYCLWCRCGASWWRRRWERW